MSKIVNDLKSDQTKVVLNGGELYSPNSKQKITKKCNQLLVELTIISVILS